MSCLSKVGILGLVAAALLTTSRAFAQEEGIDHSLLVYLLAPTIEGDVGVGDVVLEAELSASDIFDMLDSGAMLLYRADGPRWSFTGDLIYMDLGVEGTGPGGRLEAAAGFDQLTLGLMGGRRLSPVTTVLFGALLVDVSGDLTLDLLPRPITADLGDTWVDPMVGVRFDTPLSERWGLLTELNVGGFGVGSDFSWQAGLQASARLSRLIDLVFGFRFLGIDYEDGQGDDRFVFDQIQGGPFLGVKFAFGR